MLKKYRPYFFIFLIFFVSLLLCTLSTTSFFRSLYSYFTNPNFNPNCDIDSEKMLKYNIFTIMYNSLFNKANLIKFDSTIIFATVYFQVFLPAFVSIGGYIFYQDLNTIFSLQFYRHNKRTNLYLLHALKISLLIALASFIAFTLIFAFIFWFTSGELSSFNLSRELLIDILPIGFYSRYAHFYYYLVGILQFFILPFVYAFFACAMAILAKNTKQVFLLANSYYYVLASVCFFLAYILPYPFRLFANYLNPTFIFGSNEYHNVKTILVILPLLIPFSISYIMLHLKNKKRS